MVSVLSDTRQINLAGGGKDYTLAATRRQVGKKIRVTDVQYFSYGGPTWTVLVKTPPNFEWVAHVNIVKGKEKNNIKRGSEYNNRVKCRKQRHFY